jgi:hypothetical protein
MQKNSSEKFALVKTSLDAHTMGIMSIAELLRDCGYNVIIADNNISDALSNYEYESARRIVINWIKNIQCTYFGISYRLDQNDALNIIRYFMHEFYNDKLFTFQGGLVKKILFGGLSDACKVLEEEYREHIITFKGGESINETLIKLNIPKNKIPKNLLEGTKYDGSRLNFGKDIIDSKEYLNFSTIDRSGYLEYGTNKDSITGRLNNLHGLSFPLTRAHMGPYSSTKSRIESVNEFAQWVKWIAKDGYLDILSIGSSQLTQSNFMEDWTEKPNGGGVPINSPEEFSMIWRESRPMLVRSYSCTKNVLQNAKILDETINNCWHALSLWWFNKLDGRGPYNLYNNLHHHIETLYYIANINKPFEPNVSHHFSFRGSDDVTYIVSAYLAVKLAKIIGIKTVILQNMLNTPKYTWGIQDLAKSRALLSIVRGLESPDFLIILQPRAGLDYFSENIEKAKIQLAAVTALMDDIEANNKSPPIVHIVSYSEGSFLADPDVINESIKITLYSLKRYRELKKHNKVEDMNRNDDVNERMNELIESSKTIISAIENIIKDTYSVDGFYKIFACGFLPVPFLWKEKEELRYACNFKTKLINGGVKVVDDNENAITSERIISYAKDNLEEISYNMEVLQG